MKTENVVLAVFAVIVMGGAMYMFGTTVVSANASTATVSVMSVAAMAEETPPMVAATSTPTVDYVLATMESARATSDEAQRLYNLELMHASQTADARAFEQARWAETERAAQETHVAETAAYQPTAEWLTQLDGTTEANRVLAAQLEAANMREAPTATVRAAKAAAEAQFAPVKAAGSILLILLGVAICILLVVVIALRIYDDWMRSMREATAVDSQPDDKKRTEVHFTSDQDGYLQYYIDDWTGIATDDQLYAVAFGVLVEDRTLAIGNWYGVKNGVQQPFTRTEFEVFLQALVQGIGPEKRKLAIELGSGHVVLNSQGRDYFKQIMDTPPTA